MIVETAWIFDIDGVVTNPSDKKVSEPQILSHIANKLKAREPVAFNTGRSSSWLIERVINPLLAMIGNRSVLENFIAVAEKGGCWVTFDKDGTMREHRDDSISVPVGKGFATERILDLLKKKGIKPKQFIAFGDSPSDIAMAEKLHERNLSFTFIFVDNKGELKGREHPFPIVYTKNRFDKGTLEFLGEHSGGL